MEKYMTKAKTMSMVIESIKTLEVELNCVNSRLLSILEYSLIVRLFNGLTSQLGEYQINRNDAIKLKAIEIRKCIKKAKLYV